MRNFSWRTKKSAKAQLERTSRKSSASVVPELGTAGPGPGTLTGNTDPRDENSRHETMDEAFSHALNPPVEEPGQESDLMEVDAPMNAWIAPLIEEWRSITAINGSNETIGIESLTQILHYPHSLSPSPNLKSTLIKKPHQLVCGSHPPPRDVIQDARLCESDLVIMAMDMGQARMSNVDLDDAVDFFARGKESDITICSLFQIKDVLVSTDNGLSFPDFMEPLEGYVIHQILPNHESPWLHAYVPGGSITWPHIDTFTDSQYTAHFTGRKLWLFWPPTPENLKAVCLASFQGGGHQMDPRKAIRSLTGLETLLVENDSRLCWIMPPGTIHCVFTFSRIATHSGFNVNHFDWWKDAIAPTEDVLSLISSVKSNSDTAAPEYLRDMMKSMQRWEKLISKCKKKGKGDLSKWIQKTKRELGENMERRNIELG
ncbi:hypothetical protein D9756_010724 [Leucocoprinus leucothites]|uniref:JmjC domain-containing protein n=1 Tax=Leucocoprinus leucothites TaxID=201217 RepID=A0A8H5FSL0_9AGAR|nr:hypothetical protein D9756_010724 [Leucoagaricus leucothites]